MWAQTGSGGRVNLSNVFALEPYSTSSGTVWWVRAKVDGSSSGELLAGSFATKEEALARIQTLIMGAA